MLLNIVDNAVKYSQEKGVIEITLEKLDNMAKLSVKDNGIGISPDDQKMIFDRFFRSDTARAHAQKGTGLGLAICKWIAESHQGYIHVEITKGQGSRFIITLQLLNHA